VVFVRRELARIYCGWVGGYLPTEAQWEKAARGADDERLFPWGDWYDCSHGNANWCIGDTLQVGSYEVNRSPYGAMDMSGNVWEFVNDHYAPDYYSTSPYENPTGPVDDTGALTLRGGGFTWWGNPSVSVRHPGISQDAVQFNIGFRCAYDEDAR
jgi:formylglycine-generating enzyme required for sulfatase activity